MKAARNLLGATILAILACGCAQNPTESTPDQGSTTLMPGADASNAAGAFQRLDANHDGYVSGEEYMVNGNRGQSFASCDTDHDGKLDSAEFMQCAQLPQSTNPDQQ
ncbi:MAG: hypothetical protein ACREPP_04590 [Rhodanobacteraceae bacterium]